MPPLRELNLVTPDERARCVEFARDVAAGLDAAPRHLPCRYFYDREGSLLFEEICALPEYYLTRAERQILAERSAEIAAQFSGPASLVELGSGSASKTRLLIEGFLARHGALRYVPVDISRAILEESSRALLRDYPALEILAVAADYHVGLRHLAAERDRPKLVLWLGSNVGNLDRPDAVGFLRQVRETMGPDDRLLIGIDRRKAPAIIEAAYNDGRGITARFNKNILGRINRDLGGHFNLTRWEHRATYDRETGCVGIYVVSAHSQTVAIDRLEREFEFAAGEAVHTENSYKYSLAEIDALATAAGFTVERQWFDRDRLFSENLMRPSPPSS
jgi:dimethylhistidine N-methyltransferase